jgi:hypothetical protein
LLLAWKGTVDMPDSLDEDEKDGLSERVRMRGGIEVVAAVGDEGTVGGVGFGGGKKNPKPRDAAIRERREGRG